MHWLDTGPNECSFSHMTLNINSDTLYDDWLGIIEPLKAKCEMLDIYQISDSDESCWAKWIYFNNKIEGAGMITETATQDVLMKHEAHTKAEKEVLNMYNLLKKTQCGHTTFSACAIDRPRILQWHRKLFSGTMDEMGRFRNYGVQATCQDGSIHLFPHHSTLVKYCDQLFETFYHVAKEVDRHAGLKTLHAFGLAAFVQYYFVDIHPFGDGNGRLCRFLSNHILQVVLPYPFPMFINRSAYLRAIERCRAKHDFMPLAEFMIDEALSFYSK